MNPTRAPHSSEAGPPGTHLRRHGARLVLDNVSTMRLSARNQLDGVVVRVDHGVVMTTVVIRLDGGEEVVSAITKDSADALELSEGDQVKAVIKATEVMIGKD
jgi:molybdopterin-binding protein